MKPQTPSAPTRSPGLTPEQAREENRRLFPLAAAMRDVWAEAGLNPTVSYTKSVDGGHKGWPMAEGIQSLVGSEEFFRRTIAGQKKSPAPLRGRAEGHHQEDE